MHCKLDVFGEFLNQLKVYISPSILEYKNNKTIHIDTSLDCISEFFHMLIFVWGMRTSTSGVSLLTLVTIFISSRALDCVRTPCMYLIRESLKNKSFVSRKFLSSVSFSFTQIRNNPQVIQFNSQAHFCTPEKLYTWCIVT